MPAGVLPGLHAAPRRDMAVTVIRASEVRAGDVITELTTPEGEWLLVVAVDPVARTITLDIGDGGTVAVAMGGPRAAVLRQDLLPLG